MAYSGGRFHYRLLLRFAHQFHPYAVRLVFTRLRLTSDISIHLALDIFLGTRHIHVPEYPP